MDRSKKTVLVLVVWPVLLVMNFQFAIYLANENKIIGQLSIF